MRLLLTWVLVVFKLLIVIMRLELFTWDCISLGLSIYQKSLGDAWWRTSSPCAGISSSSPISSPSGWAEHVHPSVSSEACSLFWKYQQLRLRNLKMMRLQWLLLDRRLISSYLWVLETCAFTSESTCELYLRLVHVLVSLPVSLNLTCVFTCVFGELVTWDYLAWIQGQRCEGEGWISGGATSRWRKGSGEWWYSGNGYRSCTCEGGGAGNWWGWGDARQLERDLPEAEEEGHQDDWWVEKSEED